MAEHRRLDQSRDDPCAVGLHKRASRRFVSFSRGGVENKRGRIRRVNSRYTIIAILATLSASLALAEDFKTISGKEYKNATVSRVEPDGLVVKTKSGIVKVYFAELPKEVQERFHYDPANAAQFNAAVQAELNRSTAAGPKGPTTTPANSAQQVDVSDGLRLSFEYRPRARIEEWSLRDSNPRNLAGLGSKTLLVLL